ncbi:MAG: site-specific DNA-methyltransferase, partial [Gammaproteobacteria bacterium]
KCVCIDPPYNTGSMFGHYDDNLEHAEWLEMMFPRLVLLRDLLADDGSIWIVIDDDESHYLKVIMDEIFGRKNFVANVVWQKKFSPQNDAKWLSDSHDHILVYAKNKEKWRPFLLPRSDKAKSRYKNPDNDPRGVWTSSDISVKTYSREYDYPITTPSGRVINPAHGRCWMTSRENLQKFIKDNRIWFGIKGNNIPREKKFLSEVKAGVTPLTIWTHEEAGHNQDGKKEVKAFNSAEVFATPKPEKLIRRILHLATKPGDLVLDSFLGSGTAAVAHKTGRRWIGVEMGEHALTHCIPRLQKVIGGETGGVSKAAGWTGGGGFWHANLGAEIFDGRGGIRPQLKFAELAAHVWFAETKTPLRPQKTKTPFLGIHNRAGCALLYNGVLKDKSARGGNALTAATLRKIRAKARNINKFFAECPFWGLIGYDASHA